MENVTTQHFHPESVGPLYSIGDIGAGLAFAEVADELAAAIAEPGSAAVVQAPPGSGKTTLVPPIVVNARADHSKVIVTQPRRVAARTAARRLAELAARSHPELADTVAFTVRGESTLTDRTRIEFVTPGVLLRRLIRDPELSGVGAVVIDEVHERALDTDLAMSLLVDVCGLREDLTLLALSATLDAPRFASFLGADGGEPAPVIDSPTALFPIEVRQKPFPHPRLTERGVSRDFLTHVGQVAVNALREGGDLADSDVLVFAPGAWEVEQIAHAARLHLERASAETVEVYELHGRIPSREQDAIVRGRGPKQPRRIIVSTALAESSLTVPGVRIVVDTGLSREVRRDAARNMSGLVTVTTPRSGMTQREGRAGRLGPGLAIRCFDDTVFAGAREHSSPEVASADLTDAMLLLAAWGTPEGRGLRLLDPFPAGAKADAVSTLRAIGAIGTDGRTTSRGERLARIPADPRLSRALADAPALLQGDVRTVATVVAALGLGAPLPLDGTLREAPRAPKRRLKSEAARFEKQAKTAAAGNVAASVGPETAAAAHAPDSTARALDSSPHAPDSHAPGFPPPVDPAHKAGVVVALAFPERIARRVDGQVYELAGGSRAGLPAGHPAAGEWIALAEVTRSKARDAAGTGALIRDAAPLTEAEALTCGAALAGEHDHMDFDERGAKARRVRALGAITLSSTPTAVSGDAARDAVLAGVRAAGLSILGWTEESRQLRARLALLHREIGGSWPAVDDASLLADLPTIAGPELDALAGLGRNKPLPPSRIDPIDILRRLLPWPAAARLDDLAPERLRVPSGSHIRLHYPETDPDEPVRLSVKLQEMFGCETTPRIVDGRVPVLCELLSPARRPLAITDDLASFWDGPYTHVRGEMRGRYPKHPWPEDPRTVEATAKTNRALRNS